MANNHVKNKATRSPHPAPGNAKHSPSPPTLQRSNSESAMDSFLESKGLWRKPVAKDGSCLFRVVAEEVYNSQSVHVDVRNECIHYMKDHADMFSGFVGEPFDHYLYKMRSPKEWAGELEIVALSKMYNVDFVVYQDVSMEPINVTNNGSEKQISLCYSNGNHYDVIYPRGHKESAACAQGILHDVVESALSASLLKEKSDHTISGNAKSASYTSHNGKQRVSTGYRNIELEVFDEAKREQQSTDQQFAKKLQLHVKDHCTVLLRDPRVSDKSYHNAVIEEVVIEGEQYRVFVDTLQDSVLVTFEDIDVPCNDAYKDLSGYYRKSDSKEESYKVQSGKKRRNPRGGRGGHGRGRQEGDARRDDRDVKPGQPSEKGGGRNRKAETKRSQEHGNTTANARAQPKQHATAIHPGEVADIATQSASFESEIEKLPTTKVESPLPTVRGEEKKPDESPQQFWSRLNTKSVKPLENTIPLAEIAPPPVTKVSIEAQLQSDHPRADVASDVPTAMPKETIGLAPDQNNVESHTRHDSPAQSSVWGTQKINKASQRIPKVNQRPVEFVNDHYAAPAHEIKDETLTDPNVTTLPLAGADCDAYSMCTSSASASAVTTKQPGTTEVFSTDNGAAVTSDMSAEAAPSQSSGGKNNLNKYRILKKDPPKESYSWDDTSLSGVAAHPTVTRDTSAEDMDRKEKKVSFAADVTQFEPGTDGNIPDLVNGKEQCNAVVPPPAELHQLPEVAAAQPTPPFVTPNQQTHGFMLQHFGFMNISVDPDGKDLPSDHAILQFFYNYGIQQLFLRQQQELQLQLHAAGQFVHPMAVSTHQSMMTSSYPYNATGDGNGMFSGNRYNVQATDEMYDNAQHNLPHQQHQQQQQRWKSQTGDARGGGMKEQQGRGNKKSYGYNRAFRQ